MINDRERDAKNSRTATTYRWYRMVPGLIRTIDRGLRNEISMYSGGGLLKKKVRQSITDRSATAS